MKCVHLSETEGMRNGANGPRKETVMRCDFPDNEPHRFVDCPTWLLQLVSGGQMVRPERDCATCPAYRQGGAA
ncbi:hypothetical protein [Martelella sp. FOR1707]